MKYLFLSAIFAMAFQCSSKQEKEYKSSFMEGCAQSVFGATNDEALITEYCECAYNEYRKVIPEIVDLDQQDITQDQEEQLKEGVEANCLSILGIDSDEHDHDGHEH